MTSFEVLSPSSSVAVTLPVYVPGLVYVRVTARPLNAPSANSQRYVSSPPSGSYPEAENRVSSGAAPVAGSANASITGVPGSGMSMPKDTVLVASTLPALSVERYSTVC